MSLAENRVREAYARLAGIVKIIGKRSKKKNTFHWWRCGSTAWISGCSQWMKCGISLSVMIVSRFLAYVTCADQSTKLSDDSQK